MRARALAQTLPAFGLVIIASLAPGCMAAGEPEATDEVDESVDAIGPVWVGRTTQEAPEFRRLKSPSDGIKIYPSASQAKADARIIYSVQLPNFASIDTIATRAEVQISRCAPVDIGGGSKDAATSPCPQMHKNNAYNYNPQVYVAFVQAKSLTGKGKLISQWFESTCDRSEHHCAIALPEVAKKLNPSDGKYIHLVLAAAHKDAKPGQIMEIDEGQGTLTVSKFNLPNEHRFDSKKLITTKVLDVGVPGDSTRELFYQVKLPNLQAGDVIDIDGKLIARKHSENPCHPLLTTQVVLSTNPADLNGGANTSFGAMNGRNCASPPDCIRKKSGALQVQKAGTYYVSLVGRALKNCADDAGQNRRWEAVTGGWLNARVRR